MANSIVSHAIQIAFRFLFIRITFSIESVSVLIVFTYHILIKHLQKYKKLLHDANFWAVILQKLKRNDGGTAIVCRFHRHSMYYHHPPLGGTRGGFIIPLEGGTEGFLLLMLLLLVLSVFGNLALTNVGKTVVLVVL